MKIFERIVGQSKAIEILTTAAIAAEKKRDTQEMTHAWLFTGPPGSGRSNLAIAFAASLVCSKQGCGDCIDCRTALLGNHQDVEIFSIEGVTIKVDDIRELVSRSSWGASLASWRVVIIEDCDRMTESAANALLKAIEEPGSQNVWLLCAPTIDDVLPTIRSRCRSISLTTPTTIEVSNFLQSNFGINQEEANIAASVAQGHLGRARHYALDKDLHKLRQRILQLFLSISDERSAIKVASQLQEIAIARAETSNQERNDKEEELLRATVQGPNRGLLSGGTKALKDLEKMQKTRTTRAIRDELDTFMIWLQSVIRDALLPTEGDQKFKINPDLQRETDVLKGKFTSTQLENLTRRINQYRATLDSNAAQLLSLESFCLDFQSAQNGR